MPCAIKIISKVALSDSSAEQQQMQSELQMLESLSHPHIISLYELLHDEDYFYIVTELISQGNLYLEVIKK